MKTSMIVLELESTMRNILRAYLRDSGAKRRSNLIKTKKQVGQI